MLNALPCTTRRVERVAIPTGDLADLSAWRIGTRVGEAPCWDADTRSLVFIDIRAPAVHRLVPDTAQLTTWHLPEVVGAMGLAKDDSVVVALKHRLALLHLPTGEFTGTHTLDGQPAGNRLNDGKVSPSGRWFVFGSMDDAPTDKLPTGSLFVASRHGGVQPLWEGLTVANGIAFSADACTLFFSDSFAGRVWRAPWNEALGSMGMPELICTPDDAAGRPDGAALDSLGHYWSAGVSAGCLNRFSAEGVLLARLPLPCRAPTMPCFAGPGLNQLFVTSLVRPGWQLTAEHFDGDLLSFTTAATGLPSPRWA